MSIYEKELIKKSTFDELWNYLWGEQIGIQYRGEEKVSREKFEVLSIGIEGKVSYNLEKIIENTSTTWDEPEWGFPKGRRNYQEKDLGCALREFEEETGYLKSNIKLLQNIVPYEEIFTGSNMKSYKHKYFLGYIDSSTDSTNSFQETEIRPYNLEKKDILEKVNTVLQQYGLY